ncbi:hypothetical protein BZA05DRAFT_391687 [Tricharina praecox]|uniref:uncharacterized protein n=1 Tax=Tricharina praecox TaxID=43433 RepID=UPI00221F3C03|nr:uncharacterized protein BZA05DRAFT_391687 [Tricharina praecox]KAI5855481.1 hypothetical protein BZA05DRAFT_391687 [Tricharina praecox]
MHPYAKPPLRYCNLKPTSKTFPTTPPRPITQPRRIPHSPHHAPSSPSKAQITMRPSPRSMALAMFRFPSLRATKRVTIIKGQSTNLHIKGVFKPGSPAILIVSTAPEEEILDIQNFQKYVSDIMSKKWPDTELLGGRIEYGLSIAFEKRRVRRVETVEDIIELAKTKGFPDADLVEKWVRARLERCKGIGPWNMTKGQITFSGVLGGREEVLARQRMADVVPRGDKAIRLNVSPFHRPHTDPKEKDIMAVRPGILIDRGRVRFDGLLKPQPVEDDGQKGLVNRPMHTILKPTRTEPIESHSGPTIRRPTLFRDASPEPERKDPHYPAPMDGPVITKLSEYREYLPGEVRTQLSGEERDREREREREKLREMERERQRLREMEGKKPVQVQEPEKAVYKQMVRKDTEKASAIAAKFAELERMISEDEALKPTHGEKLYQYKRQSSIEHDVDVDKSFDYAKSPSSQDRSYDSKHPSTPSSQEQSYSRQGAQRSELQQGRYSPPRSQEQSYDRQNRSPSYSDRERPQRDYRYARSSEQRDSTLPPHPPTSPTSPPETPEGASANPSPAKKLKIIRFASGPTDDESPLEPSAVIINDKDTHTGPVITWPWHHVPPSEDGTPPPIRYHQVDRPRGLIRRHYCS